MPACFYHEQVAMQALEKAHIRIPDPLLPLCLMGAQGPDLLFCYRLITRQNGISISPYGRMMHTMSTGVFLASLGDQAQTQAPLQAFTLGFLSHYAADTTVHPYVYGHHIEHLALEKRMDRALYRMKTGKGSIPLYNAWIKQTRPYWNAIASAWGNAAQVIYPDSGLDQTVILQAFKDTYRLTPFMQSRTSAWYRLARLLEKAMPKHPELITRHIISNGSEQEDVLNRNKNTWVSPFEPTRSRAESVLDLEAISVDLACQWMSQMQAFWQGQCSKDALLASLGNLSYLSGLPCNQAQNDQ